MWKKAAITAICIAIVMNMTVCGIHAADSDMEELRQKAVDMMTGGEDIENGGEYVVAALNREDAEAIEYSSDITIGNALWDDLKDTGAGKNSSHVTQSYQRLYQMAVAYNRPTSDLYKKTTVKNNIISALDVFHSNIYNYSTNIRTDGNWWDWEIGSPLALTKTVLLMYGDISEEKRTEYMKTVEYYVPNVRYRGRGTSMKETGANLANKCEAKLYQAIIEGNEAKLNDALDGMKNINNFVYSYGEIVTSTYATDGFYNDGSFIQHVHIPYTGGYGSSYLGSFAAIISLLKDTNYEMEPSLADGLCEKMELAFYPVFYNGLMMDMVRGREIVKWQEHDMEKGSSVLAGMLRAASGASDKYRESICKFVSSQINYENYYSWNGANAIMLMQQMLPQSKEPQEFMVRQLNSMARTVQKNDGHAVGISMSSKRTGYYEAVSGQNAKGWFTGFGMMYLYDKDIKQFGEGFWNNVDMTRLPGTTVSKKPQDAKNDAAPKPSNDFAGGANLDTVAVSGMELVGYDNTLTAKKSWFLFEDKIVALGSNIKCTDGYEVQTIIENKRIYGNSEEKKIYFNGLEIGLNQDTGGNVDTSGKNWGYIENNAVEGIGTGYIFDDNTSLYADVYTGGSDKYAVIASSSDTNPSSGKYAYAILPNRTREEVVDFEENRDYNILRQDENVHAVKSNGVLGVNFWTNGEKTVDYITADKKATVVSEEKNGELSVGICDTTQSNSGNIIVELDKKAANIIELDRDIEILSMYPKVRLKINVKGAEGRVFRAKFNLIEEDKRYLPYIKILRPAEGEAVLQNAANRIVVDTYCANDEVVKVEYYCNGMLVGTSEQEPFYFDWLCGGEGEYEITAKAYNSFGNVSDDTIAVRAGSTAYALQNRILYDFVGYDTKDGGVRPPKLDTIWFDANNVGTVTGENDCLVISQVKSGNAIADSSRINADMKTGGKYRIKMNVKFSNTSMKRSLLKSKGKDLSNNNAYDIDFLVFGDNGTVYSEYRGTQSQIMGSYQPDKWYEIILELNMKESGQEKYSLIINGTTHRNNVDFPNKGYIARIESFRFNQYAAEDEEGSMYIKDIEVADMADYSGKILPSVYINPMEDIDGYKMISLTARDFDYGIESAKFYVDGTYIGSCKNSPYWIYYGGGQGGNLTVRIKSKDGKEYDFDGGSIEEFEEKPESRKLITAFCGAFDKYGNKYSSDEKDFSSIGVMNISNEVISVDAFIALITENEMTGCKFNGVDEIKPNEAVNLYYGKTTYGNSLKIYLWNEKMQPLNEFITLE